MKPQRRFSKPSQKRSELIQVRITLAQYKALRASAAETGLPLTDVVRNALARATGVT
jgi:uncharacterized protein (DUF1778 family)